jgi:hypothetical protein
MVPSLSSPALPRSPARLRLLAPRLVALGWMLLAACPVAFIAWNAVIHSRDVVFWDEFDTALDLILQLDAGAGWRETLGRFLAVNSEHRMVTSRVLFALSYWFTGTLNFHVFGALGNLFIVAACAILVVAARTPERRVRLGLVLAFLVFQLEHFENFLWSGASIDHFQVPLLAVAALAATLRGSARALVFAGACALAATFTLAHGTLVWPVCGALLLAQRRGRHAAGWCTAAALAALAFLDGYTISPEHRLGSPGTALLDLGRYWLALLGGPLTLGDAGFAPVPGVALLLALAVVLRHGGLRREPLLVGTALFAIASLALVAVGRLGVAPTTDINSRYLILGVFAWATLLAALLELAATPQRPWRWLLWLLPALVGFNLAANVRFAPLATGFVEARDRAYTMFKTYGADGRGLVRLHPREGRADTLLRAAAERGIYQLPRVSRFVALRRTAPSSRLIAHVDQFMATSRSIMVSGWGMIPGLASRRGQVHVVLRSPRTFLVLSTVTLQRPDVAQAYHEPRWRLSGFRAVISPDRLPAEDFEIGVLVKDGDRAEFIMTSNRLLLSSGSPRALPAPPPS